MSDDFRALVVFKHAEGKEKERKKMNGSIVKNSEEIEIVAVHSEKYFVSNLSVHTRVQLHMIVAL